MAPVADGPLVDRAEAPSRPLLPCERAPLRVALVADCARQPRWIAEAFAALAGSAFARVVAIADLEASETRPGWLWRTYLRLDSAAFGNRPAPLERVVLAAHVAHDCTLSGTLEECRAALAELAPDVVFALGAVPVGALCANARYGAWRWAFGSDAHTEDVFAGLEEVQGGALVSRACVTACTVADGERLLCDTHTRTFAFSLARTRDNLLARASGLAARALKNAHEGGEPWLRAQPATRAPSRATPGGMELAAFAPRIGARVLRGLRDQRLSIGQWFLGVRFGSPAHWDGLGGFHPLLPPKDRFWADPCAVQHNGRFYVFFEELVFSRGRAHIAMMEVRRDGRASPAVPVLEHDCHLSYPFLFEDEGTLYMIPESGERSRVELYRCVRFPDEWRPEKVLLEGAFFTDATVLHADGRWWMFVNVFPAGTQGTDELHLFHAERLTGEWRPHARNPLKSDVRGARPAGALYREGAGLYRPAQIGAPLYGWGIAIHRVERLSPTDYLEREVMRIAPEPERRVLGVHTLNRAGELTVIDAFTRRPRLGDCLPTFPRGAVRARPTLSPCP